MSAWDEAVILAAAVERDQRLGRADDLGPYSALVTADRDGAIRAVCSCGDLDDENGDTNARRTMQRLAAHVQLHATAAAKLIPWSEVRARRAMMNLGPGRN